MRFIFVLLTALFIAAPSLAQEIKHTEAGVSYHLPSDWKTKKDGGMVETSTADDSYHVLFLGLAKKDLEASIKAIGKELEKVGLKDVKTEEPQEWFSIDAEAPGRKAANQGQCRPRPSSWSMGKLSHCTAGSKASRPSGSPSRMAHLRRRVWLLVVKSFAPQATPGSSPMRPKTSRIVPLQASAMVSSPLWFRLPVR